MDVLEHESVWVIYTGNHLTDVVAEREDGDVLPHERAVEYIRADPYKGAVEAVRAMGSAWRAHDDEAIYDALVQLEDAFGLTEQGGR